MKLNLPCLIWVRAKNGQGKNWNSETVSYYYVLLEFHLRHLWEKIGWTSIFTYMTRWQHFGQFAIWDQIFNFVAIVINNAIQYLACSSSPVLEDSIIKQRIGRRNSEWLSKFSLWLLGRNNALALKVSCYL